MYAQYKSSTRLPSWQRDAIEMEDKINNSYVVLIQGEIADFIEFT